MPLPFSPEKKERRTTLARARRSATPIPPYEPPPDIFTPPRQVFINPPATSTVRSSRRKTGTKAKKPLKIVIKQEMPDIDLTLPMPPPSPSDDPLLLVGTREAPMEVERYPTPPRRHASVQAETSDFLLSFVTKVEEEGNDSLQPAATDDEHDSSPFPSAAQFFPPSDDDYDGEPSQIDAVDALVQNYSLNDTSPSPAQASQQLDRPDEDQEPLQFDSVVTPAQKSGTEDAESPSASAAIHSPAPVAFGQERSQKVSQINESSPRTSELAQVEDDPSLRYSPQPTSSLPTQERHQHSSQREVRANLPLESSAHDEETLPRLLAPPFSHRWDFSGLGDVERSRPGSPPHLAEQPLCDQPTTAGQSIGDASPRPSPPAAGVRSSPAVNQDWDEEDLEVSQVEAIVSPAQTFRAEESGFLLSHDVQFSPLHSDDWDKSFKSSTPFPRRPHAVAEEDEEDSDSDTELDTSLVKISSVDPRAAARAAAILKQVCTFFCSVMLRLNFGSIATIVLRKVQRHARATAASATLSGGQTFMMYRVLECRSLGVGRPWALV